MTAQKLSYSDKLKDPRWQKKRLEILNRDEFKCTLCGDVKTTLHVHHKEYAGDPWECEDDLLTTHCEHCHMIVEWLKGINIVIRTKKFRLADNEILVIVCVDEDGIVLTRILDNTIQYGTLFTKEQLEDIFKFYKSGINGPNQNG